MDSEVPNPGEVNVGENEVKINKHISRRDFLQITSAVGLAISLGGVGRLLTPEEFYRVVRDQIVAYEKGQDWFVAPVSKTKPDADGSHGYIIKDELRPRSPVTTPQWSGELNVALRTPDIHYRTVRYFKKTGDMPVITLELGVHGQLNELEPSNSVTPVYIASSAEQVSIDSLPSIAHTVYREGAEALRIRVRNEAITNKDKKVAKIQLDQRFVDMQIVKDNINMFRQWVKFDEDHRPPELLATDIATLGIYMNVTRSPVQHFESAYQQFQDAMRTANITGICIAIKSIIESNIGDKNSVDPNPSNSTSISRRDFFRRSFSAGATALASILTFKTLQDTKRAAESHRSLFRGIQQYYENSPTPGELSPAGFRGVVEYLLDQQPGDLSPGTIYMLARDLLSVYKTLVIGGDYAVWGAYHTNQIGLFELSPSQVLEYIKVLKNRFGGKYFDLRSEMPFELQLCTATGYTIDYDKQFKRGGITDTIVKDVSLYIFPELYDVFIDEIQ